MDIKEYFENKEIKVTTKGKNVTSGWINIKCPFCYDHSNHMGVDIKSNFFNCWLCSEKGHISKLIKEIEKCSWSKAKQISDNLTNNNYDDYDDYEFKPLNTNILPKECSDIFPKKHINYLLSRNFNANYLIKKYKLKACNTTGKYRFRIIAPVFINHNLVSFIAVDVTKKAKLKYILCPNTETIYPKRKIIYNIDSAKDKIIIVEGITDVWRLGNGAVGLIGKKITKDQINLLIEKEIIKATIILDSDAIDQAKEIANQLSGIIDEVKLIELKDGDPDNLNIKDIEYIKNTAFN